MGVSFIRGGGGKGCFLCRASRFFLRNEPCAICLKYRIAGWEDLTVPTEGSENAAGIGRCVRDVPDVPVRKAGQDRQGVVRRGSKEKGAKDDLRVFAGTRHYEANDPCRLVRQVKKFRC
jgi:hypothetical protein